MWSVTMIGELRNIKGVALWMTGSALGLPSAPTLNQGSENFEKTKAKKQNAREQLRSSHPGSR